MKTIAFTIPEYMTSLILPKCAMVHGQIVATVYLQIALNLNHRNNVEPWKQKSCWLYKKTIAERTGYSERFIGPALQTLENLDLITIGSRNLLAVYRLKNNEIKSTKELYDFNLALEAKLLDGLSKTQTEDYISSFRELEAINQLDTIFQYERLLRVAWFEDLNLLRNWISQSENIYKGSSLFFINNLASSLFKYTKEKNEDEEECQELGYYTNKQRALLVGTSPSTVSRYVNSFIDAGCLTIDKYSANTPQCLKLNDKFLTNKKNLISVVDEEMKEENTIKCPICGKEFDTYKDLGVHISKTNDAQHKHFKVLKNQAKCKTYSDLQTLYIENKNDIEELADKPIEVKVDKYLQIPTGCGYDISCAKCYKLYRIDEIWLECQEARKLAYMTEYDIKEDGKVTAKEVVKKVAKTEEPVNVEVKKVEEIKNDVIGLTKNDFDCVKGKTTKTGKPKKLRQDNPDSPAGLVNYFYNKIQKGCLHYAKDTGLVNKAMKEGVTPDGVRMTMDYMADVKKLDNLNFFSNSLGESYEYNQFVPELEIEGTAPYLLKMYYEGLGIPLNHARLVFEVKKIKALFGNYSYEQLYAVIKYMIAINCTTINFIGNKVGEALAKMKQVAANKNNPCLYDREDLHHIKSDLVNGRKKIKDVEEKFREDAIKLAKTIIKEGKAPSNFGGIEWAWYIGLELDSELRNLATGNIKCPYLDKVIDDPATKPETRQKAIKARDVFYAWVNKQMTTFEQREVM